MGSRRRRLLNQSTHSSVANSMASKFRHGPRRWMARQKDFYVRRDHADRTARIRRLRCASSASTPARIIMSPITTSITARAQTGPKSASTAAGTEEPPCLARASRRQPNNCDGCMPMRRAIAETLAPGSIASATARSLKSSDQRRRNCRGAPSKGSGTASII